MSPVGSGCFQLDGLMLRRVHVGKRSACELFGPGDIVRPWDADGEYDPLPISLDWIVLRPTRLAVLDAAFALRTARWPAITGQLCGRIAQRARHLALTQAITHLPRAHPRLLMLFWILADRWGTVSAEGVRVTLPLTHETLAMLVGSRPADRHDRAPAPGPRRTARCASRATAGCSRTARSSCWPIPRASPCSKASAGELGAVPAPPAPRR